MLEIFKRKLFYLKSVKQEEKHDLPTEELGPEDARATVIATVSEFNDIPVEHVTNNTLLGDAGSTICLILCIQFRRTIFADSDTTVGELIAQLEVV